MELKPLAPLLNHLFVDDFINQQILEEWLFSVEAQLETAKRLRKVLPPVTFAVEVNQQFHREKAYVPRWDIGANNAGEINNPAIVTVPIGVPR